MLKNCLGLGTDLTPWLEEKLPYESWLLNWTLPKLGVSVTLFNLSTGNAKAHWVYCGKKVLMVQQNTQRQLMYRELPNMINAGDEPQKIPQLSDTWWLSIVCYQERILDQQDALKLHFGIAINEDRCYKAGLMHEMYRNPLYKLYRLFLLPVLKQDYSSQQVFPVGLSFSS